MAKWSVNVEKLVSTKKVELRQKANAFIKTLFWDVMLKSPVRTGQFRANWNISFESPNTSYVLGMTNFEQTNAKELSKIDVHDRRRVWLTNGLPYATALEHRFISVLDTPGGMIRLSVIDAMNKSLK